MFHKMGLDKKERAFVVGEEANDNLERESILGEFLVGG